ncbi:MAG: Tfp pilus assembly protein FimT/FimU [Alphaproteobacteria bacterium]
MRNSSASAGYSLLELLVVIAILAIVMTAGLPYAARALDSLTIESDARLAAARIRELRSDAMDLQRDITLSLPGGPRASLESSDGRTIELSRGTTASIEGTGPSPAIVIGWDGSVSGRLVLSNGRKTLRLLQRAPHAPVIIEAAP